MKELEGTSPVTCLKVHNFKQTPEELDALVRWSSNLEELCIRLERSWYGGSPRSWGGWTFAVVQPILEAQMASLRQLSIVGADNNNDDITRDIENLDLTGFVNLEVLTLPSYFTGLDKRHIPRILAPNLRIFNWLGPFYNSTDRWVIPEEWVMPDDGVSPDEWGIPADWVYSDKRIEDFGQEQEDWVRAMVDFASKTQQKLREIYIAFKDQERGRGDDKPCLVSPCERLERIARDSEDLGIKIRY
ncbi:hypothetical protein LB507_006674 [Fusarium sp. FIESC RH6]|nr:hypothetical protein LB507_006674 [Fusarium sp. FIESC RH6]